jgi:acetone carboxylase, beta subunit
VVTGRVEVEKPVLPELPESSGEPTSKGTRQVWWTEGSVETKLYELAEVGAGQAIAGPAIIESPSTTFAIPPGRSAGLDRNGIFHLVSDG